MICNDLRRIASRHHPKRQDGWKRESDGFTVAKIPGVRQDELRREMGWLRVPERGKGRGYGFWRLLLPTRRRRDIQLRWSLTIRATL